MLSWTRLGGQTLIAARSEVTLAETLLDKTRIRAPIAGKVLQINAKVGELVAPTPELPLVVVGDMSIVRVRAEVDEPDVAKIKLGQRVSVKNNAYPGPPRNAGSSEQVRG